MKSILEKVINLESLLENSRPIRNHEQIFNMVADLKTSLTIDEIINNPIEFTELADEDVTAFLETFVEDSIKDETTQPTPVKKTPTKPKPKTKK
jgi:hypothetical protein